MASLTFVSLVSFVVTRRWHRLDTFLRHVLPRVFLIGRSLVEPLRVSSERLLRRSDMGLTEALGADREPGQPPFEVGRVARRTRRRGDRRPHEQLEFMPARSTDIFVNGHRTILSHHPEARTHSLDSV